MTLQMAMIYGTAAQIMLFLIAVACGEKRLSFWLAVMVIICAVFAWRTH